MVSKIKLFIRESILKISSFLWRRAPVWLRVKIINFINTFYERNRFSLVEKNTERRKPVQKETSTSTQKIPLISIIIPTFNQPQRLRDCLKAIKRNTKYENYEVLLIDNNSFDKESLKIIKRSRHRVIKYPYRFNYSKANNLAARYAKGEYLLFLNNDTRPTKNWLIPMLNECKKEGVGIVGSKLLFDDNTIQHAGVTFYGEDLQFSHICVNQPANVEEANYAREVPAITGACMLIRKRLFEQVGGLDEEYWLEYQDIDLCYKVKKLGLKIIYTPFSVAYHQQGATRGIAPKDMALHDSLRLRKRWFYNHQITDHSSTTRKAPHKILLIKLLDMGGVIMATSIVEAIRKRYPQSEITFATSQQYQDILNENPYLDRLYLCRDYAQGEFYNEINYYRTMTIGLLHKDDWDLSYQLQMLDLPYGCWQTNLHRRDLFADLANVKIENERPAIFIKDHHRSRVKSILNTYVRDKKAKKILLYATSGAGTEGWDHKKYTLLIKKIRDNYNARIFQISRNSDTDIMDKEIIHLKNMLSIKETAALMGLSDILISPDSGWIHMASAMGLSIVALFGPTKPSICGPIDGENYICIKGDRGYLEDISADLVFDAVNKLLNTDTAITQTWWKGKVYEGLYR